MRCPLDESVMGMKKKKNESVALFPLVCLPSPSAGECSIRLMLTCCLTSFVENERNEDNVLFPTSACYCVVVVSLAIEHLSRVFLDY